MAQRTKRPRDISLTIHTFSLTASPSGSYGVKLSGKAPAMVAMVQTGSVFYKAGLQVGDFVLKLSGQDIRTADGETILRILREAVGRTVEVGVARPYPVPVTDKEKMRALIVLQTKLDSGSIFQKDAPDYQTAVQNALAATQDILGDLGLDIPQSVPDTTRQSGVQEVEIKMYDSDSLPSPPPSSESDTEQDPLLDFTRNDDLTYNTGQKPSQTLAESVREATKALEGIQKLTTGLKKKEKKTTAQVSSVATFQPSGRVTNDDARNESPITDDKSPAPFEVNEEELQWIEPVKSSVEHISALDTAEVPHANKPTTPPLTSSQPPIPPHANKPTAHSPFSQSSAQEPPPTHKSPSHQGIPPPVPAHGRSRHAEEQSKRGEKEDTRRQIERELARRDRAATEEKKKGEGVVIRRQAPKAPPTGRSADHVPLRMKLNKDRPAGIEEDGMVVGKPSGYKKLHPPPSHPAPEPPSEDPVTDLSNQETALQGLPPSVVSWHSEEVEVWLYQLSPTLSHHYRACFSRHDITGQALMRLNLSKLKSMGIDNIKHCRQLALEIAKLKIYQESLELKELEEENQLSFI